MRKLPFINHNPDQPCKHMEPMINKAHDGRLSKFLMAYLKQHLAGCEGCRNFYHSLGSLATKLRQSKSEPMDQTTLDRLSQKLSDASRSADPPD